MQHIIEEARALLAGDGFLRGEIENLPPREGGKIDLVIGPGVFDPSLDEPGVVAEAFRTLRPGRRPPTDRRAVRSTTSRSIRIGVLGCRRLSGHKDRFGGSRPVALPAVGAARPAVSRRPESRTAGFSCTSGRRN